MRAIVFSFFIGIFLLVYLEVFGDGYCNSQPQLRYAQLLAIQCDSMIKANAENPNFVILDVRTSGEYIPQHLEGAININVNSSSFDEQLKALDLNKIYLIHCKSGGRSASAFNKMKAQAFREVYEMAGGINSWKSNSLPTTNTFACKLAVYECNLRSEEPVEIGTTDTIFLKITNAANDTLQINYIEGAGNGNFQVLNPEEILLLGAENYELLVVYTPGSTSIDSINITINSNGGNKEVTIVRNGSNTTNLEFYTETDVLIYPNPASEKITISTPSKIDALQLVDLSGRIAFTKKHLKTNVIDVSEVPNGIYLVKIQSNNKIHLNKLLIYH